MMGRPPAETARPDLPEIGPHPERRGVYRLRTVVWVPAPRAAVFEFFGDAFQLEAITPPWLHFHVVTPRPIEMRPGITIDYRLRIHGIPIWWQSRISEWAPPDQFVDEQLRGPYRLWHHRHTFTEEAGGTLMRDEVDYAVPGGPLVHTLFVRKDLLEIFAFRRRTLLEIFGGTGHSPAGGAPVIP